MTIVTFQSAMREHISDLGLADMHYKENSKQILDRLIFFKGLHDAQVKELKKYGKKHYETKYQKYFRQIKHLEQQVSAQALLIEEFKSVKIKQDNEITELKLTLKKLGRTL
jgi:type II secretory pathway predicted ATPase ExeA